MVNFRYHLVSLTAVFLALGIGVLMGVTVIDRATVQFLEGRLDALEDNLMERRRQAEELRSQLDAWEAFADQAPPELLAGRLAGVPVLVVTVEGVAREPLRQLHDWLAQAGAQDQGTITLDGRFALTGDDDVKVLATAIGVPAAQADVVRQAALSHLVVALSGAFVEGSAGRPSPPSGGGPSGNAEGASRSLMVLRDAGFLSYELGAGGPASNLAGIPSLGTRLVVVSGLGTQVPDSRLIVPLVRGLVEPNGVPLVVAETATAGRGRQERALSVPKLRQDATIASKMSTVDNLDGFIGQVATVLALEDLAEGRRGHYGVGPHSDRLLPAPRP